jgi:hypothetical protein
MSPPVKKTIDALLWVLIALLLLGTLWAVRWGARQPRVHSIWGEPSDKPITWNLVRAKTA